MRLESPVTKEEADEVNFVITITLIIIIIFSVISITVFIINFDIIVTLLIRSIRWH